jgi:hypothetical protein
MVRSERLFADRQGAFVERLGLGVAALFQVDAGQLAQASGDIRMVGSKRLLEDRQGALVQRLRLGVAALLVQGSSLLS